MSRGTPRIAIAYTDGSAAGWALAIEQGLSKWESVVGSLSELRAAEDDFALLLVVGSNSASDLPPDMPVSAARILAVETTSARSGADARTANADHDVAVVTPERFKDDLRELVARIEQMDLERGTRSEGHSLLNALGRTFRWRPAYTRTAEVLGLVTALAAIGTFIFGALRSEPSDNRVLEGDLPVAVAGFAVEGGDNDETSQAVEDLSLSYWGQVRDELEDRASRVRAGAPPLTVDVLSPTESRPAKGSSSPALAASLDALARRHGAHVILTASVSSDLRVVQPYLFLTPSAMTNAVEFAGLYEFGDAIEVRTPLADSSAARAEVREALVARAASAAELATALTRLENGQSEAAVANLESALELWPGDEGRDVLLLFLGNAWLQQEDLERAAETYEQGAELAGVAEERIGLARLELGFHQQRGDCETSGDAEAIATSRTGYLELASRGPSTVSSQFEARVQFGIARTTLCLASLQAGPTFDEASSHYLAVIRYYEAGDELLRDIAAESYAGLAVVASRSGVTWDQAFCATEQACYLRASEVAVDPTRQRLFQELGDG